MAMTQQQAAQAALTDLLTGEEQYTMEQIQLLMKEHFELDISPEEIMRVNEVVTMEPEQLTQAVSRYTVDLLKAADLSMEQVQAELSKKFPGMGEVPAEFIQQADAFVRSNAMTSKGELGIGANNASGVKDFNAAHGGDMDELDAEIAALEAQHAARFGGAVVKQAAPTLGKPVSQARSFTEEKAITGASMRMDHEQAALRSAMLQHMQYCQQIGDEAAYRIAAQDFQAEGFTE